MTTSARSTGSGEVIRFDVFELDVSAGELRKHGIRLPIQGIPVQILAILAGKPGNLVTRDELRRQLWAEDTFVDFDHSIRNAIARLREVIGDSADSPRYVETLPRRGYRFIGQVVPAVKTAAPATHAKPTRRQNPSMTFVAAVALCAVLIALGGFAYQRLSQRSPLSRVRSLAILPLENLSRDPEQEYFAEGITEELTTELAQISALKVISHTSAVQYKESKKSMPQIARELGVDAVIEGAVQRSGDKVSITVQLIEGSSDRHLWAKSFEKGMGNVLELQKEVTHAIVDEIQAKLTRPEQAHLANARPVNSNSYEDYLKGHFFLERRELKKSVAYFQQAIEEDPHNAHAFAGLANAYISLGQPWYPDADLRPRDVLRQAKAAANKALEIDDSLGEAHLALARVVQLDDWNWRIVEREYRRALELNQNDRLAHSDFGEYLQEMGRNDEALMEFRRAETLDPLDAMGAAGIGFAFYTARRYDEAMAEFHKALHRDPDLIDAHVGLGWVYEQKGMYAAAARELEKAVELSHRDDVPLASLAKVLAESGKKAAAIAILRELGQRSEKRYVSPCLLALVELGLGEREQAMGSLQRGYANRDQWILYLKVDPHLDGLRSELRFQDLIRQLNIP